MVKKLLIWVEERFAGKLLFQRFFESLNRISIRGMNYRRGGNVGTSGEAYAMRYAKARLRAKGVEKPLVFDVGANVGQFLDEFLKEFGENITCYTFEPAEKTFEGLVAHFKGKPCVLPFKNGFGKEEGEIILYSNHDLSTIASLYPIYDMEENTVMTIKERIKLRTIDNFCEEHGIKQIDYLKIDVEGAELDVLKGAVRMISERRVPFVQFEFGPNNMSARVYMRDFWLALKDYKIYRIVQNGIRELHYTELLEVPLLSNYIAELRD